MINYLNDLLTHLLITRAGLTASQISFNPPDQDWRTLVAGTTTIALNLYLVELYENVALRSNERITQSNGGSIEQVRAPARLDCRYLISAWSPTKASAMTKPAQDEAVLLFTVTQVLMDAVPLDARVIYGGAPPGGFPPEMLDPPLPAVVAPPEPFPKLADFWMRMDTIWKPVVDLVVVMPVVHAVQPAGPPVTTLIDRYGTVDRPDLEELIAIGGVVRAPSNDPVPGAWVRLVELNETVVANAAGQFVFSGIRRGGYRLQAGAVGHKTALRPIDVPSLTGEYDVKLG